MGIATQISEKILKPIDTKLSKTTKLTDLGDDKRTEFQELYSHSKLTVRLLGVLLNGVFTERKTEFLMSLPLFRKLLSSDSDNKNIERRTINDKEYKLFVASLVKNQLIYLVEKSQKKSFDSPSGKAGTWKVIDPCSLSLVSSSNSSEETRNQKYQIY